MLKTLIFPLIPAKAGIQNWCNWVPAFAGTSARELAAYYSAATREARLCAETM